MDTETVINRQFKSLKTTVDAVADYIEEKGRDGLDRAELANLDRLMSNIINTAHNVRQTIKAGD